VLRGGDVPETLAAALEATDFPRERLLAALPADLSPDGRFAERWLAVSRDGLAVVEKTGGDLYRVSLTERFAGLTGLEYRSEAGGGIALVRRGKEQRELVRCSKPVGRAVQAAIAKLRQHLGLDKDKPGAGQVAAEAGRPAGNRIEPPQAAAELDDEATARFLAQLGDLGEQRYCAGCGLPLRQDSAVCPICVRPGRTLLRVLGLAAQYRWRLAGLVGLLVATIFFRLIPPYLLGRIFDVALVPKEPAPSEDYRLRYLCWAVAALFGAGLLAALLRIVAGRLGVAVGASVSRDLRESVFRHLQWLSLGYFARRKTGALMTRVNGDTQQLQGFLVDGVQYTMVNVLEITLISGVLFWLNWRLALLTVLTAPVVIIVTRMVWRRIMRLYRRLWEVISRMSAVLNDSLRGIRVVKAFGGEEQEIVRFERASGAALRATLGAELFWITLTPLLNLIMGLGLYLVLLSGGGAMISGAEAFGSPSAGLLVQFMQYLPMLYAPLQVITRLNEWLTRSMTAAERIFEILDTRPEVPEHPAATAMPRLEGRIELRGVSFGYEKHSPVLRHLDLDIRAGEMIGLVGHSGAGKSTTINLITRLYDTDEGQILIDGVDIRRIRTTDLRRQIGVVLQETFLFTGTIAENIAYARPAAGREEIVSAARQANAHEFIMGRPDGYDSEVEEGGNNFSSGEKQRLAIARAILHDPRILILDEATSSVDTKTEQQIQEALGRLTASRTTIAIAHRLSTLRHASRLVVMEKGEIRDVGSHQELCAREGLYHDLVKAQNEMASVIAVGS
jgi:ATP-binding cassette subfamily B protein